MLLFSAAIQHRNLAAATQTPSDKKRHKPVLGAGSKIIN